MVKTIKSVAIIGAGPSGITAARQAILYGFEPTVFEKNSIFGGLWAYTDNPKERSIMYNTVMNYSKELSVFSELPPSEKFANFMHHVEVFEYLNSYIERFDLFKYIRFQHEVVEVSRHENWKETGCWNVKIVNLSNNENYLFEFDAVLICTGMYSKPYRPFEWRWERKFKGKIIHSQNFKTCQNYYNKVVVVVGFGNSAVDCACNLAGVAKQVYLSTRRGSWLLPQLSKNGGLPWDFSYNSRILALGRKFVPKYLRNWLWEMELNARFDHHAARIQPKHRFLSANFTFSNDLPRNLTTGRVKIMRNILSFTETGVEFEDGSIVEHVILCTGYKFDFPFLEEGKLIFIRENDFHLYKHMFLPDLSDHNNLALIGFVQPQGPIFPVAEMQSRFFFHTLSGQHKLPSSFEMKRELEEKRCDISLSYLKTHRHTQIEDYIEYLDDLASSINVIPRFKNILLSNPKLAWSCVVGPAVPYQYRLNGIHSSTTAAQMILDVNQRMFANGKSSYPSILSFYALILGLLTFLIYAVFFK